MAEEATRGTGGGRIQLNYLIDRLEKEIARLKRALKRAEKKAEEAK